jgi:hypothetical protein
VSTPQFNNIIAEITNGIEIKAADAPMLLNNPKTPPSAPRIPPNLELAAMIPDPVPRRMDGIDFRGIWNQHCDDTASADE